MLLKCLKTIKISIAAQKALPPRIRIKSENTNKNREEKTWRQKRPKRDIILMNRNVFSDEFRESEPTGNTCKRCTRQLTEKNNSIRTMSNFSSNFVVSEFNCSIVWRATQIHSLDASTSSSNFIIIYMFMRTPNESLQFAAS